ncbi:hypothetical protein ACHAW5_001361 [Stephanodiscus triporus]|uniref:Uncharacterized protein n=1 Tax=Stephanodiscus triporus TaxID=2934178 RepID=A0ABD3P3D8_9STRA
MAKEFDNTESQIILPSYPVVRASKRTINREQSAVEQEIELETRRRRKSKKQAALRRRPREYDSGDSSDDNYDRRGSQIPIHLRKAPPETLGLSSTTGMYHNYGRVLESQISLPLRKASKEPVRWTDEEEEKAEEESSRQESHIYLMRNRKKQYPAEMHHGGEKRVININATTTATTMMSKLSKERTSRNEQQESVIVESQIPLHLMSRRQFRTTLRSTQNNHDNSEDSSDEWMKVRRCNPAQRSRSVASPPKQMTTHAAGATAASDESTESLFESQIAGEGSEESVPPPPPPPPIVSSSRKESSAATTTTTYHHEDDTDDDENQNPMETIRGEGDVREKIYKAPLIPPNNHSSAYGGGNGGGPDHHRVHFDIDRTSNTIVNCEMSSISTRASNILGLSTSPTCTTTLVSRHEPRNEGFRSLKFGDISDDEGNNVARNKRKLKARKQFDIAQVLERAKRLCGL